MTDILKSQIFPKYPIQFNEIPPTSKISLKSKQWLKCLWNLQNDWNEILAHFRYFGRILVALDVSWVFWIFGVHFGLFNGFGVF